MIIEDAIEWYYNNWNAEAVAVDSSDDNSVRLDKSKAVQWLSKAAEQDHVDALVLLSGFY